MPAKLPLPRGRKRRVRSSVLHILAVGHHDQPAWCAMPQLLQRQIVRGIDEFVHSHGRADHRPGRKRQMQVTGLLIHRMGDIRSIFSRSPGMQ